MSRPVVESSCGDRCLCLIHYSRYFVVSLETIICTIISKHALTTLTLGCVVFIARNVHTVCEDVFEGFEKGIIHSFIA